ncbi:MAG: hypothetical protein H6716_26400 [Polyangiaceae bacterium]|nr:hypothetical protein [Polyangiaceae bacterium]
MNLCIATRLRNIAPGGTSGELLLSSANEQRQFLEVIRERAQVAMIDYALLGSVFVAPTVVGYDSSGFPLEPLDSRQRIPELQHWAAQCALGLEGGCSGYDSTDSHLNAMGRDFASAVQLHVTVTEEILDLMGRSASSLEPVEEELTGVDAVWGQGSWRQRLLATTFGGDPLAVSASDGTWSHPLGYEFPGADSSNSSGIFQFLGTAFPTPLETPYHTRAIRDPKVWELFALGKSFNSLALERGDGECEVFDEESTGEALYKLTEAALRIRDCVSAPGGVCETSLATQIPTLPYPEEEYLLHSKYQLTPEHAATLARFLRDAVRGPIKSITGCVEGLPQLPGPQDLILNGEEPASLATFASVGPRAVFLVSANLSFVDHDGRDLAPKYTDLATLRLPAPWEIAPRRDAGRQGFFYEDGVCFPAPCIAHQSAAKRSMGSVSALSAVRHLLISTLSYANSPQAPSASRERLNDYLGESENILKVVDGAIGARSVAVKPAQAAGVGTDIVVASANLTEPERIWQAHISVPADDSFWADTDAIYELCVVDGGLAGNLAKAPTDAMRVDYPTFSQVAQFDFDYCGSALEILTDPTGATRNFSATFRLPDVGGTIFFDEKVGRTLVARRTSNGEFAYQLQATQLSMNPDYIDDGQYFANGGTLSAKVVEQLQSRPENPIQPRYDAFGLPTDWVPPFNAELFGGQPGQSSADLFMSLAKQSSEEATRAVEAAAEGLIEEQADEESAGNRAVLARKAIAQARDEMCGIGNDCDDVKLIKRKLPSELIPPDPRANIANCRNQSVLSSNAKVRMECIVGAMWDSFLGTEISFAEPVFEHLKDPSPPSFDEYAGGELQTALIEQWRAASAPGEKLKAVSANLQAAKSSMDLADASLKRAEQRVQDACDSLGITVATDASMRLYEGIAAGALTGGPGAISSVSGFFNDMRDAIERCEEVTKDLAVEKKRHINARDEAFSALASSVQGTVDAQAALLQSGASIQQVVNRTKMKVAMANLEDGLSASNGRTSSGVFRQYRAYDLWRARALVENSRRYALAARRAVEAHYVVNLEEITEQEAFVESPAIWANDVYKYDLSLPSAVGLAVGETKDGAIYSNAVVDYVSNLQSFVSGYAASRPSSIATEEIEVLNLPGLSGEDMYLIDENGDVCGTTPELPCFGALADRGQWSVQCPGSESWVPLDPEQPASQACPKTCELCGLPAGCFTEEVTLCNVHPKPIAARLSFSLDPWGRLNAGTTSSPYKNRFNARWGRMAVNVVGTGVKDCSKADDPLACYNEGFVRYNLTHVGPAWVTDFGGGWRSLALPLGRIEGAKAIAAELWLDPLKDGWGTPYISAVARSEFAVRPLGGAYQLTIALDDTIVIDRIERIQLLVGSNYWVQQQ